MRLQVLFGKVMNFNQKVYTIVKKIPKGRVVSYGQIAAMIGSPRSARVVGWAMHQLDSLFPEQVEQYPWWRVINAKGMISTTCHEHTAQAQKEHLEEDGVTVEEREGSFWVDIEKYRWSREK